MFVTGYDEANRADLGWQQSHPEKSGKQALKFISFSEKGRAGRVHILNQSLSTKFCAHGFEVSVLTRNSLTVNSLSYQVFKNLFENKKNERLFTGCTIGTDRKNGSKNVLKPYSKHRKSESRIRDVDIIWPEMVFHNRNCVFMNDDNKSNNDNTIMIMIMKIYISGSLAQKLAML